MTFATSSTDSPHSRLVASRKALVRQMTRADGGSENSFSVNSPQTNHEAAGAEINRKRRGAWQVITEAAMAGWQHHPVHIAVDIGRPFLVKYARDKPMQLLGIAAGIGAGAVLVKPWRLVSLTGLALAAFKSTNLSSTLLSLLTRAAPGLNREEKQQSPKGMQ